LRKQGELEIIGGAYYITELTSRVASAANIEFHSRIIIQKYIQRELDPYFDGNVLTYGL
jgi:replicative DNA helicase